MSLLHLHSEKRIFGLDLMRAIAIVMVLSSHILWIYPPDNGIISQVFQLFGYLGVEIFFVLSGFLIGRIVYRLYLRDDFTVSSVLYFLKRRWFRTLPNYYLVLLINILISFIVGYSIQDVWKYFFFLQNFASPMLPFFTESWSLSVEEFAYLLFPVALFLKTLLVKPINKSRFFLYVVIGFIFFFFFTKVWYAFTTPFSAINQWNLGLKAVVIYRLDAIFLGVLFSWISLNFTAFWIKGKYVMAVLGLFLVGFLFAGVGYFQLTFTSFPLFWIIFYLPLTSLTVALFLPFLAEWKTVHFVFIQKTIVFISVISYSVYLLHYGVVLQLMKHFFNTEGLALHQLHFYTFIYLIITFFLSTLLYKFYEKPMTDLRDK